MMCRDVRGWVVGKVVIGAIALVACGHAPREAPDAGSADDAPAPPIDAGQVDGSPPDPPWTSTVVRASPTGDDVSDGVATPVRTLGRAVALATLHREVQVIALDAGAYSTTTGESFAYMIPDNVVVTGPLQGRAILSGDATKTGLIVANGQLQAIELEGFALALDIRGTVMAANLKLRDNTVALRAATSADVTLRSVDIAGTAGACATGIALEGGAVLHASDLTAGPMAAALTARDRATATLVRVTAIGDRNCNKVTVEVRSDGRFELRDSAIDGGAYGLGLYGVTQALAVNLMNVSVRNADVAIGSERSVATLSVGTLLQNSAGLLIGSGASWTLSDVHIEGTQYNAIGIGYNYARTHTTATLTMRGCTLRGNESGIDLEDDVILDLGTIASPGHNIIQGHTLAGIDAYGTLGPSRIDAVGNTWEPGVQGADASGIIPSGTISGPYGLHHGDNFWISSPLWSIKL
jgi:hypothetical protein